MPRLLSLVQQGQAMGLCTVDADTFTFRVYDEEATPENILRFLNEHEVVEAVIVTNKESIASSIKSVIPDDSIHRKQNIPVISEECASVLPENLPGICVLAYSLALGYIRFLGINVPDTRKIIVCSNKK